MRRREFITLLGGAAAAWPVAARAQQPAKVPRIGLLGLGTASAWAPRLEPLREGLRDLGYVEGNTIIIEFRWADRIEQLREHAAALVDKKVDLIFAMTSTETEAARAATTTIPIVFATHADPVGLGHVASLPRPGGNITGLTVVQTDLTAKALEIFKEALPQATRIGVLFSPAVPSHVPTLKVVETAGRKLALNVHLQPVRTAEDFDAAFVTMAREGVDGFFVLGIYAYALSPRATSRPRASAPIAGAVRRSGQRGSGRFHELRAGCARPSPPRRDLHRQDSEG